MLASTDKLVARISVLRLRVRTNVWGLPSVLRSVIVRVDDPNALLSAADQFLIAK
jgi:hypothetical protein